MKKPKLKLKIPLIGYLIPVVIYMIVHPQKCHAQNYQWAKVLTNTQALGGNVYGRSIKTDAHGNTYTTGYYSGTADFDPGIGTSNLISTRLSSDIFLAKYDAAGNYVYAKSIGGMSTDMSYGIALDGGGNVYITGSFAGTVDFDPGPGMAYLNSIASSNDIFLAKYDASGNYVYAKTIGGSGIDMSYSIAVDANGNAYITGSFTGTADFDPGSATANLVSVGSNDIFLAKYDGSGNYVFAKKLGGVYDDYSYSIAVDGIGNAYITGSFQNTIDFDPGTGIANLTSLGGTDAFFAKYDASGNYVYAKSIGGYGSDIGYGIIVDESDNTYITGAFRNTADFDPRTGTINLVSKGSDDIFLAKYDASGNYVYANAIGGTSADFGYGVAIDDNKNAYITGCFYISADFDPSAGDVLITSSGKYDIFLAKYDATGKYVFAKAIGGANDDKGYGIGVNGSGNTCFIGDFSGTVTFDPATGISPLISGTLNNSFVGKCTTNGTYLWAFQQGGHTNTSPQLDFGRSIVVDASGNSYITGYFNGTVDFDPGPGTVNLISAGLDDIFLAKYDAYGNYVYAKNIGGPGSDKSNGIVLDGSGNVYITGSFAGTTDFDPGTGTLNLISVGPSSDIFLAKYDASGNYVYAKSIGGNGSDMSYGIAVDGNGNIHVTGSFTGTADFDPGVGTSNLLSAGNSDIFFAKYDASGNYIYAKKMGGQYDDYCYSVAVDINGNLYITGSFQGTGDFDPGMGVANLTSVAGDGIFLAKYDASGNYLYAKSVGGYGSDIGYGITVDGIGNAYITGSFQNTIDFDPGTEIANLTSLGGTDAFFAKYDASGNYVFAKLIGGTSDQKGYGIALDRSDNIYISGYFAGTADFDPGTETSNLISTGLSVDIFLAKYDASGNYVYAKAMGGLNDDIGYGIAADGSNNVYIAGSASYTVNFDPESGIESRILSGFNSYDIFIAKYGIDEIVLPITLVSFKARIHQRRIVEISWDTASEFNNLYFEVQKSRDGISFEPIAKREGCIICNTPMNYAINDPHPYPGKSYYRLKQVDTDGKYNFSKVVNVYMEPATTEEVIVYPNPSTGMFFLQLEHSGKSEKFVIEVRDAAARMVLQCKTSIRVGYNNIPLNLSNFPVGIYFILIKDNNDVITQKLKVIHK